MHTGVLIITETQKGSYWNGNSVSDICVTYLGNNATQADAFICLLVYCLILESVLSDREGVHIFNCDFSSVCGGKKKMWVRIKTVVGTLDRIEMVTDYKLLLRARDGKLWKQMWNMQAVEEGFSSIHFSGSVLSYSLQPHGRHHARPPCPKPPHGACLKSCSSSWWCHSTISSSVLPFSSHLQSFPTSGSFSMSQLFVSDGQSIGASASASVLPVNIQGWFPLGWTNWISLLSKGRSRVFSDTTVQKHQFFNSQPSLWSKSHTCTWPLEKPWLWLYRPLSAKWCLCFLICCLGFS